MCKTITMILAVYVLIAGNARALEVKLLVQDPAKVTRANDPVTTGVPFARGAVKDVDRLSVRLAGDKIIPAQFLKLVPWDDGSVRWALMDCQVNIPAGGKTELVLRDDGKNRPPTNPVSIKDDAAAVTVSTGPLEFTVGKKKFNVFESLKVDGRETISQGSRGMVLYKANGDAVVAGVPETVKVEQAGPMRAIVCIKGKFPSVHNGLLGYTVRITAYAGKKFIKIQTWLENNGTFGYAGMEKYKRLKEWQYAPVLEKGEVKRPEWLTFDGMAVELGLDLGGQIEAACEGVSATAKFSVEQRCRGVKEHGRQIGYRWGDFEYAILADGKELKKGKRTDGVVMLRGDKAGLTAAIRDFWQNYEKTVALDGSTLKLWLWPTSGEWPRPTYSRSVRRGTTAYILKAWHKPGTYLLAGGVHKGYEAILDFSDRGERQAWATVARPLMARAAPAYYAATEAAPGFFAPAHAKSGDKWLDAKFQAWNQMARNAADLGGKTSIYHGRRGGGDHFGYWYGWMDFGDVCTRRKLSHDVREGARGLRFDWTWIMLLNYLRIGDRGFLDLGTDMARHRIEVDQYWSERDAPEFCGLTHFDDGGTREIHWIFSPKLRPCVLRNWLSGVVLYYMLTGEPKAYECCMANYSGIKHAWVEPKRKKPGSRDLTLKSMRPIQALCSLYDLTADKKYLTDALSLFKNHIALQWKESGPHLVGWEEGRVSGKKQRKSVGRAFCLGSQALCELYSRTGDKEVFRLLTESCEKEWPGGYRLEPLFRANVYAFVGYKTKNQDYIDEAMELFVDGFPESSSPPCFLAANWHWIEHAALQLRCGHILQYVMWKQRNGKTASPDKPTK